MWLLGGPLGFACANQDFLEFTHNFLEISGNNQAISGNFLGIRIGALVRSYAPIRISRERYEISRKLCKKCSRKYSGAKNTLRRYLGAEDEGELRSLLHPRDLHLLLEPVAILLKWERTLPPHTHYHLRNLLEISIGSKNQNDWF